MAVAADTIYLMPPKKEMIVSGGKLLLTDKDPGPALTLPIDHFFRSLAQDAGESAIGVVLSGTGSDGSRGIRAIHDAGGLVLVQSIETAKFDGMPKSAWKPAWSISSLPVEEMPANPAATTCTIPWRRERPLPCDRRRPGDGHGHHLPPAPRPLRDRLHAITSPTRSPGGLSGDCF